MQSLLAEIRACTHCAPVLPLGPNPIIAASGRTRVLLVSQAPGRLAHLSSVPFDDPSGRLLREWLDVDEPTFYDPDNFAIVPMGFCYPGKGKGGDQPPRPECAEIWRARLDAALPDDAVKLLIGQYAQKYYLGKSRRRNLTETVRNFRDYLPDFFPLPHPSPRNGIWQRKNPWFTEEVVPALREVVGPLINRS